MKVLQRGFSAVEVIIVVVVLALVGVLGYVAWDKFVATDSGTPTSEEQAAETVEVNSTEDLDKVEGTLDATEVEDSESAEAEQEANL